jgi:hypothetical protein
MGKKVDKITRRDMIRGAACLGVAGTISPREVFIMKDKKNDNPVTEENSKPGTLGWQLQYTRFDDPVTLASYPLIRNIRSSMIEGYVSRTSVYPGESIDFMVSTIPSSSFIIDIYRMGYYGGKGGRHMTRMGPFMGKPQAMPMMTVERLRECNWDIAASLTIPGDWPGGVYLGKLSRDEIKGKQSYVIFVVKGRRESDILCQVSDLTWQAYNKWPGRDSLYDDGTPEVWYTGPNVRVSFDRPYAKYCQVVDAALSCGSGEFLLWEHPMTFWLEQQGYDVNYCSNLDLEFDPAILGSARVFLSVGHDEYWSRKMFEEAIKARDRGLSFAFFSGNSISGEIQFFDSFKGVPGRVYSKTPGVHFPDEERLMGVTSYGPGYGDWVVKNSGHWIYEGTGLYDGDFIPAMIGWEYHGEPFLQVEGLVEVAGSQLMQMGDAAASTPGTQKKIHNAVVYPCPEGNWVFNAGTIWWPEGLSQPPGHIPAGYNPEMRTFGVQENIQKITSNILNRMIKDSPRKT